MHVKQDAAGDLGMALDFIESLGYAGLYSIEARPRHHTRDLRHKFGKA